ncbi:hypothetical protein [Gemmobacter sp.]|uniref:hypothetical protein n=1 Tax=Gemmobacter sp. TaxID=1898957 RepID=UPI002B0025E9|nr:hypothetical protein [Gemmobacter sp.]
MERPETGGVWIRDPKTGALAPFDAPIPPAAPKADPPAAPAENTAPEAAPPARLKKGR